MFVNILSGTGLFLSAKVSSPWHTGLLFIGAIALNSVPGYYEGLKDMRNEIIEEDIIDRGSLMRKVGLYSLILGYTVLIAKHRAMLR